MRVRDFIELLKTCDPEAEVVVPSYDHSYAAAYASQERYRLEDDGKTMTEDVYVDTPEMEKKYGKSYKCVVID